ncbi:TonB-dependent receptor [bacterium]|nr:TonB-dependent receptor [bacterium]
MRRFILILTGLIFSFFSIAQTQIRGFVNDKETGEPLISVTIQLSGTSFGTYTDQNGLYVINDVPPGNYTLVAKYYGYDTASIPISIESQELINQNVYLKSQSQQIKAVQVSAAAIRKTTEVTISETTIQPKQLQRIPSVGGEPDLVQYLQVLPGVVFSGDQGGQLYIRGGSPVMNRVMLDGLTVYNPFHSIGLFSVFDSDIIKRADVYSAGFSAEFGGRISAIVDVETRDGNMAKFAGKVNTSPFNSKLLLEGPLRKYKPGEGSSSFIVSYKNSYLDRSSRLFYPYINDGIMPFSFSDLFAKVSFNSAGGSRVSFFGFDFNDNVNFENTTQYDWGSRGMGMKFLLIPGVSRTIVDGTINYSDYLINQQEGDNKPRKSGINGYNVSLNFTNFINKHDEFKFGLETNGFRTDFEIFNALDRRISQFQNTTEISGFLNYRKVIEDKLVLELGFRIQRYASLQENSPEPRLRMKYNINKKFRFKAAAGLYSQNLMSAVSDKDVVNLFYGFLSGPENLPTEFDGAEVTSKLQKARHIVAGFEFDPIPLLEVNIEGYAKDFTQVTNINRDKIFDNNRANSDRPDALKQDYIIETGLAYGYDVTLKYETTKLYVWMVYSYNNVSRYDGIRTYQPHFDRRHNINIVTSYDFGAEKSWSANARWNFGSGFPFTLTQGFYELLSFADGATTDYTTDNGELGILYAELNTGRLPYYHRFDVSLKKTFKWEKQKGEETEEAEATTISRKIEIIGSITNVYNRANIFYFNRVEYTRVNQLPILPSLSLSYSF